MHEDGEDEDVEEMEVHDEHERHDAIHDEHVPRCAEKQDVDGQRPIEWEMIPRDLGLVRFGSHRLSPSHDDEASRINADIVENAARAHRDRATTDAFQ